jgi:hypothetical protein
MNRRLDNTMARLDAGTMSDLEASAIENAALETLERLQQERTRALAKAIDGWAAQCSVTVEEWLRHFTCLVEERWPDGSGDSFTVTFHITPVWRDDAPANRRKVKPMLVGDTYRNGQRVR